MMHQGQGQLEAGDTKVSKTQLLILRKVNLRAGSCNLLSVFVNKASLGRAVSVAQCRALALSGMHRALDPTSSTPMMKIFIRIQPHLLIDVSVVTLTYSG